MSTITAAELNERLKSQPGLALIDVRTPAEFAQVHVPPARNLPLDRLGAASLTGVDKAEPVYLLCRSGTRAAIARDKLASEGFAHPVLVEGGTLAWVNAGLPVTRGEGNVISLERQVRIGAGLLVLTGVLLGWFVSPWFFGLSGFVGAGLVFAGVTDWCGMGLLLARAPWNRAKAL